MSEIRDTDLKIAEGQSPAEPLPNDQPATPPRQAAPVSPAAEPKVAGDATSSDGVVLLENVDDYRRRWERIQSAFVDEPRRAVEQADALVAEVIRALADNPHPTGSRKLEDRGSIYRVRAGDYRILYRVEDERRVVLITNIGHRRDIYR